jgi:hypothetical protein
MAETGTVTIADVRTALSEIDTTEFPDSTIESKIQQAEIVVEYPLTERELADLDQQVYDNAVTQTAAYRTYSSQPAEMKREALDLSVTYDVQTFVNRLRDDRDFWLAMAGVSQGGTSAPVADTTDGVFHHR